MPGIEKVIMQFLGGFIVFFIISVICLAGGLILGFALSPYYFLICTTPIAIFIILSLIRIFNRSN